MQAFWSAVDFASLRHDFDMLPMQLSAADMGLPAGAADLTQSSIAPVSAAYCPSLRANAGDAANAATTRANATRVTAYPIAARAAD